MSLPPPPACPPEHRDSSALGRAQQLACWHDVAHDGVAPSPGHALRAPCALRPAGAARHVTPGEDRVVIALLPSGEMRLHVPAQGAGRRCWRDGARGSEVALARRDVAQALGREPTNMAIALARCALAPLLASQLRHLALLACQPGQLDVSEYAALLDATRALTLLMLRNLARQGQRAEPPGATSASLLLQGRRATALRFMQQHAHRHDLHADMIADGAGCSRTRLYESFAAQGETVMGCLREIRLQRARALIEQSAKLNIGALSWSCGFADQSGFSKLFRGRFGLSPTTWHQRAAAGRRR